MSRVAIAVAGASFSLFTLSCGVDEPVEPGSGAPGPIAIETHSDGTLDIADENGNIYVRRAFAEALVRSGGSDVSLSTRDCSGVFQSLAPDPTPSAYFSSLTGMRFRCETQGLSLTWDVYTDPDHDTAVAILGFENTSGNEVTLLRLSPLVSRSEEGGGLFVGQHIDRCRILDNGSNLAADVDVKLHYPDEERNELVFALIPIESRGNVVSNWNHAVIDLDSQRSFIAGALEVEHTFPTFGTTSLETRPHFQGKEGFNELVYDQQLAFEGKPIAPGESLESEPTYVDPLAPDPLTGLEDYADAVAAWQSFEVWTQRDGGRPVPNGWNSWSGSSGSGGLGTNIDEQILSENLDVMAREFEPFGVDYFQIDDGYQEKDGDWFARTDRFPSGMPALTKKITDDGLLPGIWISAFTVDNASKLAADHPDWLLGKPDRILGNLLSPGDGASVLDLSNDEALDWLADTMRRYKDDWGMRWIKLDFAYLALPNRPRKDPRLTSIEAYKRGIRKLREVLGDDVFYLGIALMGVNYGVVDAMRVSLDTGPRWEESSPFNLLGDGGNLKQAVKTGARRYYLNDRVWITHDDLMFFRSDTSLPGVVLTAEEAQTFASFIGLSSSIVKFGEDLRTLTPEQINVWRKLLPSYPSGARPMDLFQRMYPERYRLPIHGTLAGADAEWLVVGLLNWGRNYDYTTDSYPEQLPDESRTYSIDLEEWGLDPNRTYLAREFWTGEFLGEQSGTLEHTVPAHGHAIIALRESTGHPQFLGENRHFTQGATDLAAETWDPTSRTLTLAFDIDAAPTGATPFEYAFDIYIPAGFTLTTASIGPATTTTSGKVLTVHLTPNTPTRYEMVLSFA